MQLIDIITEPEWRGSRLALFNTTSNTGKSLRIWEWINDTGLDVEQSDSHARAYCYHELATLEAEGRDAYSEMRSALQPATLDVLAEMMRNCQILRFDDGDLPTFGGEEPDDTSEVWSWDETRLLVGTCADDIEIINRDA